MVSFALNVNSFLYPLSFSHIQAVTAEAMQVVNLRDEYNEYIAQSAVQAAVFTYLVKPGNTPPRNVLLPGA